MKIIHHTLLALLTMLPTAAHGMNNPLQDFMNQEEQESFYTPDSYAIPVMLPTFQTEQSPHNALPDLPLLNQQIHFLPSHEITHTTPQQINNLYHTSSPNAISANLNAQLINHIYKLFCLLLAQQAYVPPLQAANHAEHNAHPLTETQKNAYINHCFLCRTTYRTKSSAIAHTKSIAHCENDRLSTGDINKTLQTEIARGLHICTDCYICFSDQNNLENHKCTKQSPEEQYRCFLCKHIFGGAVQSNAVRHPTTKKHRKNELSKPKGFETLLNNAIKAGQHICTDCYIQFPSQEKLTNHPCYKKNHNELNNESSYTDNDDSDYQDE